MVRFGAFVRFLMLIACLVPFTSTRQALALAPFVPLTPLAPTNEAPTPAPEEDDERETDGKERFPAQAKYRLPIRELIDQLPQTHASHRRFPPRARTTPPVAADPFRNGLGSPYRC
jgi:hypothetical protein